MGEYKPKILDIGWFNGGCRSIGFSFATEHWDRAQDYYVFVSFWFFYLNLVVLRLKR